MITAIVMIDCHVDSVPQAARALAEIPGVAQVYSVTGEIDIIAVLRLPRYDDLAELVTEQIAQTPGVKSLRTHLAFREYSPTALDAGFELGLS